MYVIGKGGGGFGGLTAGTILLPNTGGHPVLAIASIASMTVGSVILLSIFSRWVAKQFYAK